jgi:hypothetical protein
LDNLRHDIPQIDNLLDASLADVKKEGIKFVI